MVNLAGLTLAIVALVGGSETAPARPVTVTMVAIQATNEGHEESEQGEDEVQDVAIQATNEGHEESEQGEDEVQDVAVQATNEGHKEIYIEPNLEQLRPELADLNYDTYRKLRSARTSAPYGTETRLPINAKYSLCVTPLSKESTGRIRLKTRIEEKRMKTVPDVRPLMPAPFVRPKTLNRASARNALEAISMLVPGDKLRLGGPKLDKGRLVVVLWVND